MTKKRSRFGKTFPLRLNKTERQTLETIAHKNETTSSGLLRSFISKEAKRLNVGGVPSDKVFNPKENAEDIKTLTRAMKTAEAMIVVIREILDIKGDEA